MGLWSFGALGAPSQAGAVKLAIEIALFSHGDS
jgi:hypothetical protein